MASAVTLNDTPTEEPETPDTEEAPAEEVPHPRKPRQEEPQAEEEPETPEETQRRKSWEGRLKKKMEEDLKAREAARCPRNPGNPG